MINLIRAESSRWVARRGLWIGLAGLVALMCAVVASIWFATMPPSSQEVAQYRQYYAESLADWEQHGEQYVEDCYRQATSDPEREECGQMRAPVEADYIPTPMTWTDAFATAATGGTIMSALGVMVMAASFWGAEYRQGSIATWLTFVPSRGRVWTAKMAVAAVAGALVVMLCTGLTLVGAWVSVWAHQGPDAVGSWSEPLQRLALGAGLGALFAVIGGALAVGFRTTVAAAALPLGYVFLQAASSLLTVIPGGHNLVTWLPENNVLAYLGLGYTFAVPVTKIGANGVEWSTIEKTITFGQGLLYLLVVTTLVALASWALFRRRDIAE